MSIIRKILMALALLGAAVAAKAQEAPYKFDFGGGIGMTGYLGDANSTPLLKHPGFSGEASVRYFPNVRWAFRGILGVSTLSGSTADIKGFVPIDGPVDFSSTVISLEARSEFNFLPYGIGESYKKLSRWSPYLMLGLGVCTATGTADVTAALELPMGFGVKYKLSPRLNLYGELSMTKVFADKIDSAQLSDMTGIKTSFFRNTDWYSRIMVGITYEFGERCQTCHYVD